MDGETAPDDAPERSESVQLERINQGRSAAAKDLREQRRDLVATMLLTKTPRREMVRQVNAVLGLHTGLGTLSDDVRVIRTRWRNRYAETFQTHVDEQMAYYDGLLRAATPRALSGDHAAMQDVLSVLAARAKLLGLDQPERMVVGVAEGPTVEAWGAAPREEQIERTDTILAILTEAGVLSPPAPNGNGNGHAPAIDV
jgi:hypothetical protein